MVLAAAGVSSVVALNNQLLLTPRSTPADWGELNYHFDQLPVGIYRLGAAQAGFQQYVRDGIQITAGYSAEVDIQMTVGAERNGHSVRGEPVLDTTSTTVSMSAGARTVADQTPATRTMLRSRPPRFSNAPLISSVSPCDSPERNPNCRQEPP